MSTEINYLAVVKKIVGLIDPVGETNTDNERFENLKAMCDLVNDLLIEISYVASINKDAYEFSVKRAGKFAENFIKTVANNYKSNT